MKLILILMLIVISGNFQLLYSLDEKDKVNIVIDASLYFPLKLSDSFYGYNLDCYYKNNIYSVNYNNLSDDPKHHIIDQYSLLVGIVFPDISSNFTIQTGAGLNTETTPYSDFRDNKEPAKVTTPYLPIIVRWYAHSRGGIGIGFSGLVSICKAKTHYGIGLTVFLGSFPEN